MRDPIYPRRIKSKLTNSMKRDQITVLTGMRRVGKTTLLRDLYENIETKNKVFLDLENRMNRRLFDPDDYDVIWENLSSKGLSADDRSHVFLDEIQLLPEITSVLKYLYDHFNVKFVVSGSSSFYLKNLFPESLAGRKQLFELYPLDFGEYLIFGEETETFSEKPLTELAESSNEYKHDQRKQRFERYLAWGGFPEVVLNRDDEFNETLLGDILTSYLEMDVQRLANIRKIKEMEELVLLLMRRIGSKLNVTTLSKEIGISRDTIYDYLEFLEKTYVIHRLQPFSRSPDREVSGQPKTYFIDTGMANQLGRQVGRGHLLENAVYLQLRRRADQIQYYQRRDGQEIDFILDQDIGIEVKETAADKDIKKLHRLADDLDLSEYYVVSLSYSDDPSVIPATLL